MRTRLNVLLALVAPVLGLTVAGCIKRAGVNNAAGVQVNKDDGTVYTADIEIAPGRKATFQLKGIKLASPEMEGDYGHRGGTDVITNISEDTLDVQVGSGVKPGNAVITVRKYDEQTNTAGRVVAIINIHVKGRGLPGASFTSGENLNLDPALPFPKAGPDAGQREVVLEQGGQVTVDVWSGRAGTATEGKDGLGVEVEPPPGGKSKKGFIKLTASNDAKVGDQVITVKSAEGRFALVGGVAGLAPDDEAESGITYFGEAKLKVTIKAK